MFAYCQNNPTIYSDTNGERIIPVLGLTDYYAIHKMVQMEIVGSYGYAMEVFVRYPGGSGRLDLFDAATNQYYEVKHNSAACISAADGQMENYDRSIIHGSLLVGYTFNHAPTRGTNRTIHGSFQYDVWDITYWLAEDGLILYRTDLNQKRLQQQTHIAAMAVGTTAVGLAVGTFMGGSERLSYLCCTEDTLWNRFFGL